MPGVYVELCGMHLDSRPSPSCFSIQANGEVGEQTKSDGRRGGGDKVSIKVSNLPTDIIEKSQ